MLAVTNVFLFEDTAASHSDVKIEKRSGDQLSFSAAEKKIIEDLHRQFYEAENKADKELNQLFKFEKKNQTANEMIDLWKVSKLVVYLLKRKDSGHIIGFCTVQPWHFAIKDSVVVKTLVISKDERTKGYGKYLLSHILKDLRKNYPDKHLLINVFDRNTLAKSLYLSLGFRPGSTLMISY